MPTKGKHLDELTKLKIVRYVLLGWKPEAIAEEIGCSNQSVRRIEKNWVLYSQTSKTPVNQGRPCKIPKEAVDDLFAWIDSFVPTEERLFLHQSEMQRYIKQKHNITVTKPTISRLLNRRKEGLVDGTEAEPTPIPQPSPQRFEPNYECPPEKRRKRPISASVRKHTAENYTPRLFDPALGMHS